MCVESQKKSSEELRQEGREEVIEFINDRLDKRIAAFLERYPDKKNSPSVVMVEELKHSINTMYTTEFMDWRDGIEK